MDLRMLLLLLCQYKMAITVLPPDPMVNVGSGTKSIPVLVPEAGQEENIVPQKISGTQINVVKQVYKKPGGTGRSRGRDALKDWAAGAASEKGGTGGRNLTDQAGSTTNSPQLQQGAKAVNRTNIYEKVMKAKAENKTKTIESIARQNPMVYMEGKKFKMGVNDPSSKTGEYPVKTVAVKPFKLDRYPVTNGDFMVFKRKKIRYRTTAEKAGHSWVFFADKTKNSTFAEPAKMKSAPWWYNVRGAYWKQPGGEGSGVMEKLFHPVVHVSYADAHAFCAWAGKRLANEYEWEYAVRGGLNGVRYPWGDKYKRNRANLWQGLFPAENHKVDGHYSLAPVNAYEAQNEFGFYDMVGNAWEWTSTVYTEPRKEVDPDNIHYVTKGGSFVDSRDGRFNHEARCAARLGLRPNHTSGNVGFRCAKTVPIAIPRETVTEPPATTSRAPKHHKYEDTWAYKVKQVVKDVLDNIKDTAKLGDEL